jgi:hypothetical protein
MPRTGGADREFQGTYNILSISDLSQYFASFESHVFPPAFPAAGAILATPVNSRQAEAPKFLWSDGSLGGSTLIFV